MSNPDDAADLLTWITLSRVAEGSVTQQGDHYLYVGAPLAPCLAAPVTTLLTEGLLTVADADPAGSRPVSLTEAGRTRHEQLGRRGAGGVGIS